MLALFEEMEDGDTDVEYESDSPDEIFETNPCKSFPEIEAISMRGPDASFKVKEI